TAKVTFFIYTHTFLLLCLVFPIRSVRPASVFPQQAAQWRMAGSERAKPSAPACCTFGRKRLSSPPTSETTRRIALSDNAKMRKLTTIGICVLLALLAAAGAWYAHDRRGGAMLRQAEALMGTNPDSARQVLEQYAPARHLRGEHQARYALLLTQARFKTYQPTDNDSLIRIAVDYYAHSSDSLRKAWSCFYAGRTYMDLHEKKQSLSFFQQTATALEGTKNYKLPSLLYYYWGMLLRDQYPYEESIKKLQCALRYDWLRSDTVDAIYTMTEIALGHMYTRDYTQAIKLLQETILLSEKKNPRMLALLYHRLSLALKMDMQYEDALYYIQKALEHTTATDTNKEIRLDIKGDILAQLGMYDSAAVYVDQRHRNDIYSRAHYQYEKAQIEEGLGHYQQALQYMKCYSSYKDSIEKKEKEQALMELQKKYDYSRVENENMRLKAEKQKRTTTFLCLLTGLTILLFILYVVHVKHNKQKEHIIQIQQKQIIEVRSKLQQQMAEIQNQEIIIKGQKEILENYEKKDALLRNELQNKLKQLEDAQKEQENLRNKILLADDVFQFIENVKSMGKKEKEKCMSSILLSPKQLDGLLSLMDLC
ncbi:MAG: hypothetical protein ACI36X_07060, partial [Bacteroidaceae bacterium]